MGHLGEEDILKAREQLVEFYLKKLEYVCSLVCMAVSYMNYYSFDRLGDEQGLFFSFSF